MNTRDGQEAVPSAAAPQWISLFHMGPWPVAEITTEEGETARVAIRHDPDTQRVLLPDGHGNGEIFHYQQLGDSDLRLEGTTPGHPSQLDLHRVKLSEFKLLSRGFHWVNEVPFNH